MIKLLVTTIPGLEDIAESEIRYYATPLYIERISPGKFIVSLSNSEYQKFLKVISCLRSVERIAKLVLDVKLERATLDLIKNSLDKSKLKDEISKIMTCYTDYAVEVKRVGKHNFTSLDVARVVGKVVGEIFSELYRREAKVFLSNPSITFHVELINNRLIICFDITGERPLHEREYKVFIHPTSLNPIIAFSMVKLAKVRSGDKVLDPMCGSATILIECGLVYKDVELYGVDINPEFIKGAYINVKKAGLESRIKLIVGDATKLSEYFPHNFFDVVISNLPYGIKAHSPYPIAKLYYSFLKELRKVIKNDAKIVLLTSKTKILEEAIKRNNYRIIETRVIEQGGLYSKIYLIQP